MIQLIVGVKGKGKTKQLLDKVNAEIKTANGNLVYIDKSLRHMHDLSNKVRLINISDYPIGNCDEFVGFLCGILSSDNDLEQIYLDSFLTIAGLEGSDITETIDKLARITDKFKTDLIISISMDEKDLPENAKPFVMVSL
ncbi:MAG: twitching motility protein PilT [Lachnospiraceae bacterium]|nr:twitching motility protein PilT [Lachnospiraceae bacterium]